METLNAILTRRSIRAFQPDEVPESQLRDILKAGMAAPSAMDEQPWHFVVVTGDKAREVLEAMQSQSPMAQTAPAAILVCCENALVKLQDFWVQDVSACTQNILLAAHDLGLGAVWVGVYPMENRISELRAKLALPDGVVPFALVALGTPAEHFGPRDIYLDDRVHRQGW